MVILIVILVLVVIIGIYVVMYNGLVQLRVHAQESWSQIDVQLQRRNDLIPNLVSTVKGYSKFEASTLAKVTELRTALNNVPDDDHAKKMEVSNQLTGTLRTLFAVSENYPDLKASAEYQQLMEELSNTENKIAYSRQLYNSTVAALNAKIQSFPSNIVAKLHHFTQMDYLQVPESAKAAPKVSFDD
ncbi:LemA family protein [Limosilactobacillus oris]|uniref:LemA family protein n=1 Tax=Limosilactobacillus oris TaxID=1632 RepID=UPI0024B35CCB|nr:LemA family protein [Limosilactobacillus oris]WHO85961.1 LemA family protein [Limosilactobacillus oris]